MSCLTKLFYHTGTTSPTDIGPASGGVLHSIVVLSAINSDPIVVKDGGSSGTVILAGGDANFAQVGQIRWNGAKLNGQLNITLPSVNTKVVVEMSELL